MLSRAVSGRLAYLCLWQVRCLLDTTETPCNAVE